MGVSWCFTFDSLLDMIFYGTRVVNICSRCTYIAHFTWLVRKSIYVLTNIQKDFPDSSVGKESACNAGDPGSIPVWRRATREGIGYLLQYSLASLVAQLVKNLPAMWETWVWSLGWEDPLEKEKLPTPVFLPGMFSPWGHKESDMTEPLSFSFNIQKMIYFTFFK